MVRVPQRLQDDLYRRIQYLSALAEERFNLTLPKLSIEFDIQGTVAGKAYPGECRLRFNPVLLVENPEAFIHEVVAHEFAHLVAYRAHGRSIRPHGPEWITIMNLFGVEPRRCHSFNVARVRRRKQLRHQYRCNCGDHFLSTTRHNRARSGRQVYVCRRCQKPLVRVV